MGHLTIEIDAEVRKCGVLGRHSSGSEKRLQWADRVGSLLVCRRGTFWMLQFSTEWTYRSP